MKKIILLSLLIMMILSICVFSVTPYVSVVKYNLVYNYTPKENFDFTDLNLYQNINSQYTGRNLPLPRYIPEYLSLNLFLNNYSTMSKKVVGIYTPRYFDGEKYTNFRIDGYNPINLNDEEKSYLDEVSLIVSPSKDTQNKCNYVAYWQFSRDFTPEYSKGNKTLYDIYYSYDLGYWYVPEIRKYFQYDCPYVFSDYKYGSVYLNPLVTALCNDDESGINNVINGVGRVNLAKRYNYSSYEDLSIQIYDDITTQKTFNGKCLIPSISNTTFYDCFSKEQLIEITKRKDDWMLKVLSGNYIPQSLLYNGDNLDNHLSGVDTRYAQCKQTTSTNKITNFFASIFDAKLREELTSCENYLQSKRNELLQITDDFTSVGVSNMIWAHYKNSYNIPKGTNLYPFNIQYAGIRCKENDTWRTYQVSPINPNVQTPYVECNYTSSDPQIVNVGFTFEVKLNPAFAMISGSDSILESYNSDYLKTLFQTYTYLSGNTTPLINIKNYSSGSTITAYFSVNRSKADGCSYTFLTNNSASMITEKIKDLTYETQKNSENVPTEVPRQLETQIKLLKAEQNKTQLYFYIDVIAKLIFRAFILFYYIISIVMFLYVIRLTILIPSTIVKVMNNIGTNKKHREHHSILNK